MTFLLSTARRSYTVDLPHARGPRDLLTCNPSGWVEARDGTFVNLTQVETIRKAADSRAPRGTIPNHQPSEFLPVT